MMNNLERLKLFLGIKDTEQDALLSEIISLVEKQLTLRIGKTDIPSDLDFIVLEISVVRYNRLGSEGLKSETIEGHRADYSADDFKPYEGILSIFKEDAPSGWQEGEVMFR